MRNTPLGGAGGFNKCGRRAEEFREAGGAHARICQGSAACHLHPMASFGPKIPSQPQVGGGEVVCRQGTAGAEGTQHAGGLQLPQPGSSTCISSSWGAPGTGRCQRCEGRILARLPSGLCLAADGGFGFQEHLATASPGARVLHWAPRLGPGELWLCLMWWQHFQGTTGTTPSEAGMFSSRLCGAFIKNRQINKRIAAH